MRWQPRPRRIAAAPSPTGGATGGEVEDHAWLFRLRPRVGLRSFVAASFGPWAGWPAVVGLGLLGAVVLIRRRRK